MELLDRVKELCRLKGISQGRMEKEIGISNGASAKWKTSSPSLDILKKLSEYFKIVICSKHMESRRKLTRNYIRETFKGSVLGMN